MLQISDGGTLGSVTFILVKRDSNWPEQNTCLLIEKENKTRSYEALIKDIFVILSNYGDIT